MRIDRLPEGVQPLKLSVDDPDGLSGREVAVIGYPARDDRNDLTVQDRIFNRIFMVKRLQPGQIRARSQVQSFQNRVNALTHDSSTLGGNSGSAVIDLTNGRVVALHFAGVYLEANYAVPAYELARDARVVARGLNFAGPVPAATSDWAFAWDRLGREAIPPPPAPVGTGTSVPTGLTSPVFATGTVSSGPTTWTITLQVTVTLGVPQSGDGITRPATVQ